MGSRNLGLDFDLARAGVKTGPYGGNGKCERQMRTANANGKCRSLSLGGGFGMTRCVFVLLPAA